MAEIIYLSVGQAGVQIGHKLWKQFACESYLDCEGNPISNDDSLEDYKPVVCFNEASSGKYSPRASFIDSEPCVIQETVGSGTWKKFYQQEYFVSGLEGAANCYARGYFVSGKDLRSKLLLSLRRMAEQCSCLENIYLFSAVGGGTGSGLSTKILQMCADMMPGPLKYLHSILPGADFESAPTCDFNTILHCAESSETHSIRFIYENDCMYKEVLPVLSPQGIDVTYSHANHLIALVNSGITAADRNLMCDLGITQYRLPTNLVPFPSLKMVQASMVPINLPDCSVLHTEYSITAEAFLTCHELSGVNSFRGKYYTCLLQYRGSCDFKKAMDAAAAVRSTLHVPFVDWIPTGFAVGNIRGDILRQPEDCWYRSMEKSVLKVSNHSDISSTLQKILDQYSRLFNARHYVQWYVQEGMEEGEFSDAAESMSNIIHSMKVPNFFPVQDDEDDDE